MKNLRKMLVFVLFALATVFAFGLNSVKAANALAYEADFVKNVSTFSYTQNKSLNVNNVPWMVSVGQYNSNVFYLGCNSSNATKGVLSNNTDTVITEVVSALGTKYTAVNMHMLCIQHKHFQLLLILHLHGMETIMLSHYTY